MQHGGYKVSRRAAIMAFPARPSVVDQERAGNNRFRPVLVGWNRPHPRAVLEAGARLGGPPRLLPVPAGTAQAVSANLGDLESLRWVNKRLLGLHQLQLARSGLVRRLEQTVNGSRGPGQGLRNRSRLHQS